MSFVEDAFFRLCDSVFLCSDSITGPGPTCVRIVVNYEIFESNETFRGAYRG